VNGDAVDQIKQILIPADILIESVIVPEEYDTVVVKSTAVLTPYREP